MGGERRIRFVMDAVVRATSSSGRDGNHGMIAVVESECLGLVEAE